MSGYEDEGVGLDSEIDDEGRNLTQQRIDDEDLPNLPVVSDPEKDARADD